MRKDVEEICKYCEHINISTLSLSVNTTEEDQKMLEPRDNPVASGEYLI